MVHPVADVVKPRLGVPPVAGEEDRRLVQRAGPAGPRAVGHRHPAVGVVDVPFQDRPGRVDEGRRVEVGVAEGVEGLVVAVVVGVVVRVAADKGVGVADRPDDLAVGLEGWGSAECGMRTRNANAESQSRTQRPERRTERPKPEMGKRKSETAATVMPHLLIIVGHHLRALDLQP